MGILLIIAIFLAVSYIIYANIATFKQVYKREQTTKEKIVSLLICFVLPLITYAILFSAGTGLWSELATGFENFDKSELTGFLDHGSDAIAAIIMTFAGVLIAIMTLLINFVVYGLSMAINIHVLLKRQVKVPGFLKVCSIIQVVLCISVAGLAIMLLII